MAWTIDFEPTAKKQLKKLHRQTQKQILDYLEYKIAPLENPRVRGEGLTANLSGLWRYRIQDYRIICRIIEQKVTVVVIKVGHRRDIYD